MIIFNSIQQLKNHLNSMQSQNKTIGFVPTMGALHQGHISLIDKAKANCDVVVCSIFVNPTQFNDLSDLEKYPRTLEDDCRLLEKAYCDVAFVPEVAEMYTKEELELKRQKIEDKSWMDGKEVDFGRLDKVMEGAHRPGHFNGVAQVVSKLFRIVEPDKGYFGQKDFQQLAIIRSMVNQLAMPIEIISCPIVREANGLAMSSRNNRLTADEWERASLISKTLFKVKELQSTLTVAELKFFVEAQIKKEPLMKLEYFEIADAETLQSITDYSQAKSAVACIALKLGNVRLIDNVILY
jgi:pantoate--beta-alanine ligase